MRYGIEIPVGTIVKIAGMKAIVKAAPKNYTCKSCLYEQLNKHNIVRLQCDDIACYKNQRTDKISIMFEIIKEKK